MYGALLGTRPARPGVLLPGAPLSESPPDPWPPPGLTMEEKIDLLLSYVGPPRYDILPGSWTLTDLILGLFGLEEY